MKYLIISLVEEDGEVGGCRDTQTHIMICPGYAELIQDKNMDYDMDIVQYFSQVIKKRLKTGCSWLFLDGGYFW